MLQCVPCITHSATQSPDATWFKYTNRNNIHHKTPTKHTNNTNSDDS